MLPRFAGRDDLRSDSQLLVEFPMRRLGHGALAYAQYVSISQINLQIPFDAPLGSDALTVSRPSTGDATLVLAVAAISPGVFRVLGNLGAVLTSTGDVAAPTGSLPDRPAWPAYRGEYVSIYCTGWEM